MSFSFFPQTVYQVKSKISGLIEVREQFGRSTLHVQGLIQSGGIVKGIWKKPLKRIKKVSRVLVLGLGGGTAIQLVKEKSPEAEIVGVEIDPEIIKIGKRFFGLGKIKKLKIVNADAFKWLKSPCGQFDLIIVDVYLGKEFPREGEGEEFLEGIKRLLTEDGMVIFNRLRIKKDNLGLFEKRLKKKFSWAESVKTLTNFFFLARS